MSGSVRKGPGTGFQLAGGYAAEIPLSLQRSAKSKSQEKIRKLATRRFFYGFSESVIVTLSQKLRFREKTELQRIAHSQ